MKNQSKAARKKAIVFLCETLRTFVVGIDIGLMVALFTARVDVLLTGVVIVVSLAVLLLTAIIYGNNDIDDIASGGKNE